MKQKLVVMKDRNIVFTGTREECYSFMKSHRYNVTWNDLRYINDDGTPGRMSSWII